MSSAFAGQLEATRRTFLSSHAGNAGLLALASLGLDHSRPTVPYDGRDTSLTDPEVTHARVIPELLR